VALQKALSANYGGMLIKKKYESTLFRKVRMSKKKKTMPVQLAMKLF